jgi:hypothetical protein
MEKLSKGITGIAGEYLAAGELSLRGFSASITLRNTESIDILAARNNAIFQIQVKTQQTSVRKWMLNVKAEKLEADNLFYIFVSFRGLLERPDYFVVPSAVVAKYVRETHADWLGATGKKGQAHNDSTMRIFEDKTAEYLEQWELLK